MPVHITDHIFFEEEGGLNFHKSFPGGKTFVCYVAFGEKQLREYQKSLFEDFLSVMVDMLTDEDISFDHTRRGFEKELQDLNTKLSIFAEKMTQVESFPIKGVVQLFYGGEYLASLIGASGLMVLREGKLNYMMSNQIDHDAKIHLFSEVIEGEVKEYDEIIALGTQIDTYIDKADMKTIFDVSEQEDKAFIEALLDILSVRVSREDVAFVCQSVVESSALFTQKKVERSVKGHLDKLGQVTEKLLPYQHYVVYATIGLAFALLMFWLVQSFLASNEARFIETNNGVVVDFTIEDIQKDIATFKRIDASSDQKIKKYQEILTKLDLLTQYNKWTNDVGELRKILENDYYKGFNIVLANNASYYNDPVYTFTQQERNVFATAKNLYYYDGLMIGGKEGVLLGAINDEVRGILVSAGVDMVFESCTPNLLKNGVYCHTVDDKIYNITKGGQVNPVTNASGPFPTAISQLETFGSSNFYVLTDDDSLNQADTYVVRYTNKLGTQETFGEGTEYVLADITSGDTSFASSGFSSFSIDGTFLTWSPTKQKMYQLWRADATANLQYREVPLLGGDTLEQYSPDVEVIAHADSRFVYLFDKAKQTFTVYRSTPYKTNDANTYTYELTYFFRIKFSVEDRYIIDTFVQHGEKSLLYLLTDTGVHALKLHEYVDTFYAKDAE